MAPEEGRSDKKAVMIRNTAYFRIGLTAFLVIAASLFLYFLLFHTRSFSNGINWLIRVMSPLIYGLMIAYILNPLMQLCENVIFRLLNSLRVKKIKRSGYYAVRLSSIIISTLTFVFIIYMMFRLLLPQLAESIQSIIDNYPVYEQNVMDWVDRNFNGTDNAFTTAEWVMSYADQFYEWFTSRLPDVENIVKTATTSILSIIKFLRNVILGYIISIYILASKEILAARFKRVLYGVWSIRTGNAVLHNLHFVDEKFGGFFLGKIIDSFIIGVITYIGCAVLKMPYPALLAVVIGITNMIPVFGPLIGAVPCALLVFVNSPMQALYFAIFIFALQQFDGNILGPFILGNSTGMSGFMVVVSIVICNGIFGIMGAFIGVPLVATLIGFAQAGLRKRMTKRNLPKELSFYDDLESISEDDLSRVLTSEQEAGSSLYDRIKTQDHTLVGQGIARFRKEETPASRARAAGGKDIPEDPVSMTKEEAEQNPNVPVIR